MTTGGPRGDVSEPQSVGELWRLVDLRFRFLDDTMAVLMTRLDTFVRQDMFEAAIASVREKQHEAERDVLEVRARMEKEIAGLTEKVDSLGKRIAENVKWIVGAFVAPVVVAIVLAVVLKGAVK